MVQEAFVFPRLRSFGVIQSVNRDMVDALARSRPFMHVACRGEELGTDQCDDLYDVYMQDLGSTTMLAGESFVFLTAIKLSYILGDDLAPIPEDGTDDSKERKKGLKE
ncbi:F-box/RNI-like superfamily protein [Abeliophyllum distichum]|uniref:F-box/RNI-like superfamily protein n=1 Tax=Abeliophyllum distichum TaxID=126358 RepID=A0ABD1QYH6_9LAMI